VGLAEIALRNVNGSFVGDVPKFLSKGCVIWNCQAVVKEGFTVKKPLLVENLLALKVVWKFVPVGKICV